MSDTTIAPSASPTTPPSLSQREKEKDDLHPRALVLPDGTPALVSADGTTSLVHADGTHTLVPTLSLSALDLEKARPLSPAEDQPATYEKLAQKNPKPTDHLSITLGPPVILLFDIVVPCIIYYTWFDIHRSRWEDSCRPYRLTGAPCPYPKPEYDKDILGYAIISFGFGELYILIARVWRLLKYPDLCAPLLSRGRWELDATSWVYGVAMITALVPFVVGSTLALPKLYLYSPAFIMAFLGSLMLATLLPIKLPIGINSHARGSRVRPFIYYAAEDFVAVDGLQDREFRVRYNARYDADPAFRRMFLLLTLWWILGVCTYIGCLSAVIWTVEFHIAFGLSLGILFAYIGVWAGTSVWFVNYSMRKQNQQKGHDLHKYHSRQALRGQTSRLRRSLHVPRISLDHYRVRVSMDRHRARQESDRPHGHADAPHPDTVAET